MHIKIVKEIKSEYRKVYQNSKAIKEKEFDFKKKRRRKKKRGGRISEKLKEKATKWKRMSFFAIFNGESLFYAILG